MIIYLPVPAIDEEDPAGVVKAVDPSLDPPITAQLLDSVAVTVGVFTQALLFAALYVY
jgi:hypothetical protein